MLTIKMGRIHLLFKFEKYIRPPFPGPVLMLLEILSRADAGNAPEGAGEVRRVGITRQAGNIRDGVFRILQEVECCFITYLLSTRINQALPIIVLSSV